MIGCDVGTITGNTDRPKILGTRIRAETDRSALQVRKPSGQERILLLSTERKGVERPAHARALGRGALMPARSNGRLCGPNFDDLAL